MTINHTHPRMNVCDVRTSLATERTRRVKECHLAIPLSHHTCLDVTRTRMLSSCAPTHSPRTARGAKFPKSAPWPSLAAWALGRPRRE